MRTAEAGTQPSAPWPDCGTATVAAVRGRGALTWCRFGLSLSLAFATGCANPVENPADLVLTNARVYTLGWAEPAPDGTPAPPHCVEDKTWAEDRLGPERVKGAYAWRTLREAGARLTFNSDLSGSDHSIFYGLHAAITRRDKDREPTRGWYPERNMTPEEAVRGYTTWSAHAAHWENQTGVLAPGRWADLTLMDIDPLVLGETDPGRILDGSILATIVAGKIVHQAAD